MARMLSLLLAATIHATCSTVPTRAGHTGEAALAWRGDVIDDVAFDAAQRSEHDATHDGSAADEDLLSWAATRAYRGASAEEFRHIPPTTELLIGVKSAVLHGFASRQLIRETWAAPDLLPLNAHVVFLGCEPDWAAFNTSDAAALQRAVRIEKATYKDLLTHELECTDSYFLLVDKVKGFLQWTASTTSSDGLAFVMLVDDDVYVRGDALIAKLLGDNSMVPRTRFYGGQVVEAQVNNKLLMNRNESNKDFVPYDVFPLQQKPAFATGAHYLLSMDLVQFLARNHEFLSGVGTLEDVSVGFWLLSLLQIRPTYLVEFDNVRYTPCHNSLLAYGDLTGDAMRRMAVNLRTNRSFCEEFSFSEAIKGPLEMVLPTIQGISNAQHVVALEYDWDLLWDMTTRTLHIVTTISSVSMNVSTSFTFIPADVNFAAVCVDLAHQIATVLPMNLIPSDFCYTYQALLSSLICETIVESPSASHLYALPLNNIHRWSGSPAVIVHLLRRAVHWRPFIESLLAASFPEAAILIELSEQTDSWKHYFYPDIIFGTADDVDDPTVWEANGFSHLPRLVVLSARLAPLRLPPQWLRPIERILVVSSVRREIYYCGRHLLIPSESLSFIDQRSHSPRLLLDMNPRPKDIRIGAVACCVSSRTESATKAAGSMMETLRALGVTVVQDPVRTESQPLYAFPVDAAVTRYHQFRFVVIDDHFPITAIYGNHHIVSAFLAGSIPIYYGHSPSVSWLFNSKAFIDCRAFDSINECAARVAHVHASADLYDAMRREPPVVNRTAFMEVFSWHPDATTTDDDEQESTMSKRFKELLMRI